MLVGLIAPPWLPVPPERYGGIEAVVDRLARGLVDAGHEVPLAAPQGSTCPVSQVPGRVVDERALTATADQACQSQLGQVLAHRRRADPGELGQTGDRGLALQQGPQQLDPGRVGQHPERLCRKVRLVVLGHRQGRQVLAHGRNHTVCIPSHICRYAQRMSTSQGDHNHPVPDHHDHEHDHAEGWCRRLVHAVAPRSHDTADSLDAALESSARGIRAVKLSLLGLGAE